MLLATEYVYGDSREDDAQYEQQAHKFFPGEEFA